MALGITNSSIGVSREGMIQVKDSIKVNLIDESINSVNTNVEQLTSNIDNYWHGSAANAFKLKVNSEKSKVITILKVLESKLELDLGSIAANNAIADAEVANAIMGISGGTLSGSGANNTSINTSTINNNNNISSQSTNNMSITQMNSSAELIDVDGNDTGFLSGLGSTVATAGISVIEGVGQFGEAAVDTLVVLEAQELAPLINVVDMGSLVYDIATGKEHHSIWDGVQNYVADQNCKFMFDGMYDEGLSSVKDHCYGFDITRGVGTGVGFTTSVILTAVGLGGPQSLAATGGSGTMSFLMGATGAFTGFGKGTEAAWSDGASWQEGITYGKASALWEGAQYYIGGEINGLSPFAKEGANSLLRVGLDVVDSGAEGFVRPALETIYSDKSYGQLFQEAGGVGNVLTQGVMGGLLSGVGEASGLASIFRQKEIEQFGIFKAANNGESSLFDHFDIKLNDNRSHISTIFDELNNGQNTFGIDQHAADKCVGAIKRLNNSWMIDEQDFRNFAQSHEYLQSVRKHPQGGDAFMMKCIDVLVDKEQIMDTNLINVIRDYISTQASDLDAAKKVFNNSFSINKTNIGEDAIKVLTDKGLDEFESYLFLKDMDRRFGGICTYATTANEILVSYMDKPELYKKNFGFDLFKINNEGEKVINDAPLLADLYSFINTDVNIQPAQFERGGSILDCFSPKKAVFSYDLDGRLIRNVGSDVQEVIIDHTLYIRDDLINSYLRSKGCELSFNHTRVRFDNNPVAVNNYGASDTSNLTKESLYKTFNSYLSDGNQIRFGINRKINHAEEKDIRFFTMDGNLFKSANSWSEGSGHSIFVTDVLENGLEVSSWGHKLFIPFDDLIDNYFTVSFGKLQNNN